MSYLFNRVLLIYSWTLCEILMMVLVIFMRKYRNFLRVHKLSSAIVLHSTGTAHSAFTDTLAWIHRAPLRRLTARAPNFLLLKKVLGMLEVIRRCDLRKASRQMCASFQGKLILKFGSGAKSQRTPCEQIQ